jgi:hypothetical protein
LLFGVSSNCFPLFHSFNRSATNTFAFTLSCARFCARKMQSNEEFEKAKAFLQQSDSKGQNLYTHLTNLLVKVVQEKPTNALEHFEQVQKAQFAFLCVVHFPLRALAYMQSHFLNFFFSCVR